MKATLLFSFLVMIVVIQDSAVECANRSYGVIHNVSLTIYNETKHIINGTLSQCLCQLFSNQSLASFNYHHTNQRCYMHKASNKTQNFIVVLNRSVSFYFLSLPIEGKIDTLLCFLFHSLRH